MSIFGRRNRQPVAVSCDAGSHVYMIHYVEHDRVIVCNAPTMQRAITWACDHMSVVIDAHAAYSRPMLYDNDRICVMLYGADQQYTCNIMRMDVHDHAMRAMITLAA